MRIGVNASSHATTTASRPGFAASARQRGAGAGPGAALTASAAADAAPAALASRAASCWPTTAHAHMSTANVTA